VVESYSIDDIKEKCMVLDPKQSKIVWDTLYWTTGEPGKNKKWYPVLHQDAPCCPNNCEFPAEFQRIKPANYGVDFSPTTLPPFG
jgi:hypothetical protein